MQYLKKRLRVIQHIGESPSCGHIFESIHVQFIVPAMKTFSKRAFRQNLKIKALSVYLSLVFICHIVKEFECVTEYIAQLMK